MSSCFLVLRYALAASCVCFFAAHSIGQTISGVITGRVFDANRGEYLETARITVDGTALETFTDESGQYRLDRVPAGRARLKVFFTGLPERTEDVVVGSGQTVQRDITFGAARSATGSREDPIKLSQVVVSAENNDLDGAAIAINEQRFSRTIMNVVAADEFGLVVDGTPGEVMKFLPGISMDYSAGEARTVSLNGVPSTNVPITVGGFDLASAASNGTTRTVNLDQFSVNNISRVEVQHSPTPESSGSALAGTVNMVPKSAFERSRPSYAASGFLMAKSGEHSFFRQPGPLFRPMRRVTPGFNFSAIVPVTKRFGFTLSANSADQYSYENVSTMTWRGVGSATSVAATATTGLPATTPDKPYLTDFAVRDSTRDNKTDSLGATIDCKPTPFDTVSFSFHWTWVGVEHNNRTMTFLVQRVLPGEWGPTFTKGAPGAFGRVNIQGAAQDWLGTTWAPSAIWRHLGRIWRGEAGVGFSNAALHVRSADKGYFRASQASRTGVAVSFSDIWYLRPGVITVTDSAGRSVNPYDLNSYSLVNADDNPRDTSDLKRNAFGNLRRDFHAWEIPLSLKGGFDVRSSRRDLRGTTKTYSYVGPDGRASTTPVGNDDIAGPMLDVEFSQRPGRFGLPSTPWLDNQKYYRAYQQHPEYFTIDQNAYYRSGVTNSKLAEEIVSALYVRADAAFFHRRLQLVGGLRAEQTNLKGQGPLTDPTRNYQRGADGKVLLGTDGKPLLIYPTTNALAVSQLTYVDRGQHTQKEYLRWFPNLNASYNVTENLILRGAVYSSVGRPDFNQYVNGLTLPDTQAVPDPQTNRISVNNAGIKAWQSNTVRLRLEYYFQHVGQVSIGAFRRDIKNFFGSTTMDATPEFLALYGLDPSTYGIYDVATNYNLPGTVRMTGFEFDYKQALTFLPPWARGVQVFANTSVLAATGAASSNFAGYIPRTFNWGASLTRPRYVIKASWNYRGAQRRALVSSGASIEPGTYNWGSKRMYIDLTGELRLWKHSTLFANVRNVGNAPEDLKIYGPHTPSYARFRQRTDYGAAITVGVKGNW